MLAAVATEGIVKILENIVSYVFDKDEEALFQCSDPKVPYLSLDFPISCRKNSDTDMKKTDLTSIDNNNRSVRGRSSSLMCSFIQFEIDEFESDKKKAAKYTNSPVSSFIRFKNDTLETISDDCDKVIWKNSDNIQQYRSGSSVNSIMWDKTINPNKDYDLDTGCDRRLFCSESIANSNSYSYRDRSGTNDKTFTAKDGICRYIYSDGETASSSTESEHVDVHKAQEVVLETKVDDGNRNANMCLENCVNLNDSFFLRRNAIRKKLRK